MRVRCTWLGQMAAQAEGLKVCCLACLVGMRPGLVDPGMKASVGELLRQKVGSACEP